MFCQDGERGESGECFVKELEEWMQALTLQASSSTYPVDGLQALPAVLSGPSLQTSQRH